MIVNDIPSGDFDEVKIHCKCCGGYLFSESIHFLPVDTFGRVIDTVEKCKWCIEDEGEKEWQRTKFPKIKTTLL